MALKTVCYLLATICVHLVDSLTLTSWNESLLQLSSARIAARDPRAMPAYYALLEAADKAMKAGPWSVMKNSYTPPSGSKHDYQSVGFYYWPCNCAAPPKCNESSSFTSTGTRRRVMLSPDACNETTGLPWVDHDGIPNNEAENRMDGPQWGGMFGATQTLSLALYFSGNQSYATKAASTLTDFFLDAATLMNPNMNFGQGIPGGVTGRGTGIIDVSPDIGPLLDSIAILSSLAPQAWPATSNTAWLKWAGNYQNWLIESPIAAQENSSTNNHKAYFDYHLLALAIATNNSTVMNQVAGRSGSLIEKQVWATGQLWQETSRTRSKHYVDYCMEALFGLATAVRDVPSATDLYNYISPTNSSGIRTAIDYVVPYAIDGKHWPFQDIDNADFGIFYEIFRRAGIVYNNATYETWAQQLPGASGQRDNVVQLLWPAM